MSQLFSKAFWINALDASLTMGAGAFLASPFATSGHYTLHGLALAGVAAGAVAFLTLVRQVGAVQALNAFKAKLGASKP